MAEHLSDEEQIENLKRWWKENGAQLLLMVVLVLGGWFGWQAWQDHNQKKAADASLVFEEIMELIQEQNLTDLGDEEQERLTSLARSLRNEYSGSQYAEYATLTLARLAVARGELEQAAEFLEQVANGAKDQELAALARARAHRRSHGKAGSVQVPGCCRRLLAATRSVCSYRRTTAAFCR